MKTLMIGAGVMGTTYGWALAVAGLDITHFVRPGKKDQFKDGVILDLVDDRRGHKKNLVAKYTMKCVETITPSDQYELIILPLHFYQVEAALQTLVPLSGNAIFLGFGSNWNGTEFIDKLLPRERYLLGFPYGGGTIQNSEYVTYLGSKVYLGEVDGKHSDKLEKVKSLFAKADIQTDVPDNILHLLWTSHSGGVGIGAGLAKSRGLTPFLHDKASMTQSYYVIKELFELCRLRGVDPYQYPDQAFLFKLPVWLFIVVLRLFCGYNAGLPRVFAHLAEPGRDARELYVAMMKTAQELKFDMPRAKVVGVHLQST